VPSPQRAGPILRLFADFADKPRHLLRFLQDGASFRSRNGFGAGPHEQLVEDGLELLIRDKSQAKILTKIQPE
jgi:hypothetical protein